MKQYRASVNSCRNCHLRLQCIGTKTQSKTIADSVDKWLYDEMHILMQSKYAKQMRNLRSSTVEPVIGTLVTFLAMKKVSGRGIEQANKQMIGAAVAYNVKKWLKWQVKKCRTAFNVLPSLQKKNVSGITLSYFIHYLKCKELKWLDLLPNLGFEGSSIIMPVNLKKELC